MEKNMKNERIGLIGFDDGKPMNTKEKIQEEEMDLLSNLTKKQKQYKDYIETIQKLFNIELIPRDILSIFTLFVSSISILRNRFVM